MTVLSDAQIASYAKAAGFPINEVGKAVAIALAESGGRTDATHTNTNGTVDRGVWQINSVHNIAGDLFDPTVNAKAAFSIWKAAGNSWSPWTTNNGAYVAFITRGETAAGGVSSNPTDGQATTGGGFGTLGSLASGGLWLRVGAFLLGTILLIVGVQQMMGVNRTIVHVVRSAVKVKGM